MDRITLNAIQGAAGAAGDDKVYVDDVQEVHTNAVFPQGMLESETG